MILWRRGDSAASCEGSWSWSLTGDSTSPWSSFSCWWWPSSGRPSPYSDSTWSPFSRYFTLQVLQTELKQWQWKSQMHPGALNTCWIFHFPWQMKHFYPECWQPSIGLWTKKSVWLKTLYGSGTLIFSNLGENVECFLKLIFLKGHFIRKREKF